LEVETGEMEVLDNVNASPTREGSDVVLCDLAGKPRRPQLGGQTARVSSDFESGRNKRSESSLHCVHKDESRGDDTSVTCRIRQAVSTPEFK
jgi:hypothetical protein